MVGSSSSRGSFKVERNETWAETDAHFSMSQNLALWEGRVVVWFSRGAASAVAAKLALAAYGTRCVVVNCNMDANEHPDNARFAKEVETWLGVSMVSIASQRYKDVDEVFVAERYMAGTDGARCTTEMKKVPRFAFQDPADIHIFGYTADEQDRIDDFTKANPELFLEWPLRDAGITKAECFGILKFAGIRRPEIYELGFNNANCIGCVKVTSPKYWLLVKQLFPEIFELRARRSRELGVKLLQLTRKTKNRERLFLDELTPDMVLKKDRMPEVSCGPFCTSPN